MQGRLMQLPAAVECRQLVKGYRGNTVLDRLDLEIAAGEFFGLVGVNGAGKTTLIKCMLDFCDISGGGITLFGIDHRDTAARENLAYLPEKFIPPYYLSGADFLDYMARLYHTGYPPAELEDMLYTLDLDAAALEKPVAQLSKGMAQKLGLTACLLSKRDITAGVHCLETPNLIIGHKFGLAFIDPMPLPPNS